MIGGRWHQHWRPCPDGPFPATPAPDMQLFLAIHAEQALVIDRVALPPQQNMQASITETPPLVGQRLHAVAQGHVVDPHSLIPRRHPTTPQHPTRPPLAHPMASHEMRDRFPLSSRRHHFFPSRSFSATLSSIVSASSRFSLAFHSSGKRSPGPFSDPPQTSSAFNRLASLTSMPPNLAFHL